MTLVAETHLFSAANCYHGIIAYSLALCTYLCSDLERSSPTLLIRSICFQCKAIFSQICHPLFVCLFDT
ncbi:hypothetical protein XENTR_v10002453 [Xenopus tropicalis]|nr:hypothetical protein XENTR_v10002453 [Xenopus tropicalis]